VETPILLVLVDLEELQDMIMLEQISQTLQDMEMVEMLHQQEILEKEQFILVEMVQLVL
jgi:hypothetical protein